MPLARAFLSVQFRAMSKFVILRMCPTSNDRNPLADVTVPLVSEASLWSRREKFQTGHGSPAPTGTGDPLRSREQSKLPWGFWVTGERQRPPPGSIPQMLTHY